MESLRSMIFRGMLLSVIGVFSAVPSALAQDEDRTTASEVVDRETLRAFVLGARDHIIGITDFNEFLELTTIAQQEGDWKHGNTYLIILDPSGIVRFHAEGVKFDGLNLSNVEDDNGEKVFPKMLAAAQSMEDGDFVEYSWDDPSDPNDPDPKACYVVQYLHPLRESHSLLVGGYYQDLSGVGTELGELPDPPPITAADVVDRETLKAFVKGSVEWTIKASELEVDRLKLLQELRREGGPWRRGSTYLFAMTEAGYVFFHAARPDQQGHNQIERQDRNGFKFVKALIDAGKSGGGYVEYYWDDPSVEGDEDIGSAKVGYTESFTFPDDFPILPGEKIIIGSGFYKGNQMALDFAHFANGGSFSSDVVLVNLAATPIRPLVYFYGKDGELMDPESMVDVMGNLFATDFGALTLPLELPPLGEVTISTHGMGGLTTGSVKVVTEGVDSPIGGVLRFDAPGIGVAGVGASQAVRDAIIPVRRQMGGIDTGAALRNLSESELTLTCRLMMGGEMLAMQTVTLPANGQAAMFISELFEHDTSDFTGSLRCTAPAGEQEFTGVAVELDADKRVFTTLPVVPLDADMTSYEEMDSEE